MRNNLPPEAVYAMCLYAVPEMRGNNHASTSCHLGLLPLSCDKEVPPLSGTKKDYALFVKLSLLTSSGFAASCPDSGAVWNSCP